MKRFFFVLVFSILHCVPAFAAPLLRDSSLTVSPVVSGLNSPTNIAFIGTNDILILQKNDGRVLRSIAGTLQPNAVLDVNVDNASERGLLGIALHPNFPATPFVYLYLTESAAGADSTGSPLANRVYRYVWNGSALISPTLILDLPVLPGPNHNGGVIAFGPDANLYVVIGDLNHNGQNQNIAGGTGPDDTSVIFRIHDDGTIPGDNPFFALGGNLARYYAYGIRNSFGLAFDPITAKLWITENGPDAYDEINVVEPGFNSGWNRLIGPANRDPNGTADLVQLPGSRYADPKFSWLRTVGPTGIAFVTSTALGPQYQFDIFAGDINNGNLYHFRPNATRDGLVFNDAGLADLVADSSAELDEVIVGTGFNGITDVTMGPDGRLYVVSFGDGAIYAITSNQPPPDTVPPDTMITSGPAGVIAIGNAAFSWTGTDNNTPTANLVYAHRLDPVETEFTAFSGATTVLYSNLANGNYTFLVKARDQAGNEDPTAASQSFSVNASASNPTITLVFNGPVRDRVGQAELALAADGMLDGVFTVTLNPGSGNRTVTRLQLTNTPGGIWNTQAPDSFWSLGVTADLDTALLNGSNDSVNFPLADGGSFKIFAADQDNRMFVNGTVFTLTANFSDGASASANATISSASQASVSLAFDGQIRDRVGQAEFALFPDGKLDGVFTVAIDPGGVNRTLIRLHLTRSGPDGIWNTQGGDGFWSLGVAPGLDAALINGGNDSITLGIPQRTQINVFAGDFEDRMFVNGSVFTIAATFSDGSSATGSTTINSAAAITASFDGLLRDRVGKAEFALAPDGELDGVFTVAVGASGGNRTVSRVQLNRAGPVGIWDTEGGDVFWSLGVAGDFDAPLINGANDAVNFPLSAGASFKIFAADFQGQMFLPGSVFTVTVNFTDGAVARTTMNLP